MDTPYSPSARRGGPASVAAGSGLVSPTDRRRSERRATRSTAATLYCAREGDRDLCKPIAFNDLSLHGVGFRCDEPLDAGRTYSLELRTGPINLTARIRIVSCRPRDDAHYDIGAEFH